MKHRQRQRWAIGIAALTVGACAAAALSAEAAGDGATVGPQRTSLLELVQAGGVVGYVIILLSVAAAALIVDAFRGITPQRLLPQGLVQQALALAREGRFREVLTVARSNDSMIGRIIAEGMEQGGLGLRAIRAAMQDRGLQETTALQQRIGYLNLIGSVAPMLGLLGTVIGMIESFQVLGVAKGAARPDQLAEGISKALVTTCMGLIVAIPVLFFDSYFRNRVTRIGQEAASICERALQCMDVAQEQRRRQGGGAAQADQG